MRAVEEKRAARVWAFRKTIEEQAAPLFRVQAARLGRIGAPSVVIDLAERAAVDERDHAERCAQICEALGHEAPPAPALGSAPTIELGDPGWDDRRRALYTSVAACCITETLATSLLIEIRATSTMPLVNDTATLILRDEVQHARLGWAHLAWEALRSDVTWLSTYLPGMVGAALQSHAEANEASNLAAYGVLSPERSSHIIRETLDSVVYPGLARFGICWELNNPSDAC